MVQIWYASPVSGALYFNLQADQTWRTHDAMELGDRFLKDLIEVCPEASTLDRTQFLPVSE